MERMLHGSACVLALGALAMAVTPASAQNGFLYPFSYPYSRPYPSADTNTLAPKPKPAHKVKPAHKLALREKKAPFGDIPKGPLQIFISISEQKLHLYSDGVHVADAAVATGVPGHATPMGVFSVIQKDRFHHSNIYSNAPMPYMQRITWSGVALHEGIGLGRPASHGCIRMPHEFAARLWVLTRLGARVIIARPELKPADFADPHLFVHKDPLPAPSAALPDLVRTAQTIDTNKKTDVVETPIAVTTVAPPHPSGPDLAAVGSVVGAAAPERPAGTTEIAPPSQPAPHDADATEEGNAAVASAAGDTPPAPSTSVTPPSPATGAGGSAPIDPAATGAAKSAAPTEPATMTAPDSKAPAEPSSAPVVDSAVSIEPAKPSTPVEPTTAAAGSDTSPAVNPETGIAAPVDPAVQDVPMPLPKPADIVKASAAKNVPIAIFVSRKESKIYVRQNFAPLFQAPIDIEDRDQPLGTHVFTAMEYLDNGTTFRWNVVSLPGEPSKPARNLGTKQMRHARGRHKVEVETAAAVLTQQTPAAALARLEIPQDVIDQISALIVPGSSLVISDQGLGPETGAGTDFIVVTR